MRVKVRLDTLSDIKEFIATTSMVDVPVTLEDGNGFRVNAKSLLGGMYAMEFDTIYCHCEKDITMPLFKWVV